MFLYLVEITCQNHELVSITRNVAQILSIKGLQFAYSSGGVRCFVLLAIYVKRPSASECEQHCKSALRLNEHSLIITAQHYDSGFTLNSLSMAPYHKLQLSVHWWLTISKSYSSSEFSRAKTWRIWFLFALPKIRWASNSPTFLCSYEWHTYILSSEFPSKELIFSKSPHLYQFTINIFIYFKPQRQVNSTSLAVDKMQFFTLTSLALGLIGTMTVSALPQNPTVLEVRQTTCTPGQSYCEVCQPHQDGFPPNCVVSLSKFQIFVSSGLAFYSIGKLTWWYTGSLRWWRNYYHDHQAVPHCLCNRVWIPRLSNSLFLSERLLWTIWMWTKLGRIWI